jgi:hypothetical protein
MHKSTVKSQLGLAKGFKALDMTENVFENLRSCAREGMLLLCPVITL